MRSYIAAQLIGTIWGVGAIVVLVEGAPIWGARGMMGVAIAYYLYSIYLWGTRPKEGK